MGVDTEQRHTGGAHLLIEVGPWGVRALGERIVTFVQDLIEDLEPLVGQTDLVRIRVCEQPRHRIPAVELVVPGGDGTVLAADVTSWFLYPRQERFDPRPQC